MSDPSDSNTYAPVARMMGAVPISVFDLFSIGIGPSSSHTVGPMRAARTFAVGLADDGLLDDVTRVRAELFGSLGATGHGHGSDRAVILGLLGEAPETVDTRRSPTRVATVRAAGRRATCWASAASSSAADDLVLHRRTSLPFHPNGMRFFAYAGDECIRERTYYSVGGGFVVDETAAGADRIKLDDTVLPLPVHDRRRAAAPGAARRGCRSAASCWPTRRRGAARTRSAAGLLHIWPVMQECVSNGCDATAGRCRAG